MSSANVEVLGRLLWAASPWGLVFARVLGLAWTAPGWSTSGLTGRSRLTLAAVLTALVAPVVAGRLAAPGDAGALGLAVAVEVAVGAAMGATASLVVAGARQAGELVGAQAGLSPAALLDPDAGDGLNPLGHLYGWVALGVFFALGGPTELVRALAESYGAVPVGGDLAGLVDGLFAGVARALALTLRAACPPALALVVAGLALGLLGRAVPSTPLLAMSLPIRTALGLALALLGLAALAATLAAAWQAGWPFVGEGGP